MLGRFLTPDPLGNLFDPTTLDPYRYADNNPVEFSDSSGLAIFCNGGWAEFKRALGLSTCQMRNSDSRAADAGSFTRGAAEGFDEAAASTVHALSLTGQAERRSGNTVLTIGYMIPGGAGIAEAIVMPGEVRDGVKSTAATAGSMIVSSANGNFRQSGRDFGTLSFQASFAAPGLAAAAISRNPGLATTSSRVSMWASSWASRARNIKPDPGIRNNPSAGGSGLAATERTLGISQQRAVRSLQAQLQDHRAKLDAYRADPHAYDNRGYLAGAQSAAIEQQIIAGRIHSLTKEIRQYQTQIDNILGGIS